MWIQTLIYYFYCISYGFIDDELIPSLSDIFPQFGSGSNGSRF